MPPLVYGSAMVQRARRTRSVSRALDHYERLHGSQHVTEMFESVNSCTDL